MRNFIMRKSLCAVIAFTFFVNDISFALQPGYTSPQATGDITPFAGDRREEINAAGQKLLTAKFGPGAINYDAMPSEFMGKVPMLEAAKIVAIADADSQSAPEGWENNGIFKVTDLVKAFEYYRDNEAQIPSEDLEVEAADYPLERGKDGEIAVTRLIRYKGTDKWKLLVHKDFVEKWNDIRKNDKLLLMDLPDPSDPAKSQRRFVSMAWAIFYRVAKHEMTDLVSQKPGTVADGTALKPKGGNFAHLTATFSDPVLDGWLQPYDGLGVMRGETAANEIRGRYALANDAIWMWFLASYCFGNSTRYNNDTLKERCLWFLGRFGTDAERQWAIVNDLPGEFPNLNNDKAIDDAVNLAQVINYHFYSDYIKAEVRPITAEKPVMSRSEYEASAPDIAEILPATGEGNIRGDKGREGVAAQGVNRIKIAVAEDGKKMAELAVDRFVAKVKSKPDGLYGIGTGSTIELFYDALLKRFKEDPSIDLSRISFIAQDEYDGLGAQYKDSYRQFIINKLIKPLRDHDKGRAPDEKKLYTFDGMTDDNQKEIRRIIGIIDMHGGIELQIIAGGANRHWAFREPAAIIGPAGFVSGNARDFNDFIFQPGFSMDEAASFITSTMRNQIEKRKQDLGAFGERLNREQQATFYIHGLTHGTKEKIYKELSGCALPFDPRKKIVLREAGEFFASPAAVVDLTPPTLMKNARFFKSLSDIPVRAFTLVGEIVKAREVIQLSNKEEMADAMYDMVTASEVTASNPFSAFINHDNFLAIMTKESSGRIPPAVLEARRYVAPATHAMASDEELSSAAQRLAAMLNQSWGIDPKHIKVSEGPYKAVVMRIAKEDSAKDCVVFEIIRDRVNGSISWNAHAYAPKSRDHMHRTYNAPITVDGLRAVMNQDTVKKVMASENLGSATERFVLPPAFGNGKKILVVGGAGYIGSMTAWMAQKLGYDVTVLDSLRLASREGVPPNVKFVQGDIFNADAVAELAAKEGFDTVMHFAADSRVGESMETPGKYYWNNTIGSWKLAKALKKAGVKNVVFSSTAATYGEPKEMPIDETFRRSPTNPYGWSKVFVEDIFSKFAELFGMKVRFLRYFNAVGGYYDPETGHHFVESRAERMSHIIERFARLLLGGKPVKLFGGPAEKTGLGSENEYDTADKTAERDYIHIWDLAMAHVLSLKNMERPDSEKVDAINLGSGVIYSNSQVAEKVKQWVERVQGKPAQEIGWKPKRPGDPTRLLAAREKAKRVLGWEPLNSDMDTICETAVRSHYAVPGGYKGTPGETKREKGEQLNYADRVISFLQDKDLEMDDAFKIQVLEQYLKDARNAINVVRTNKANAGEAFTDEDLAELSAPVFALEKALDGLTPAAPVTGEAAFEGKLAAYNTAKMIQEVKVAAYEGTVAAYKAIEDTPQAAEMKKIAKKALEEALDAMLKAKNETMFCLEELWAESEVVKLYRASDLKDGDIVIDIRTKEISDSRDTYHFAETIIQSVGENPLNYLALRPLSLTAEQRATRDRLIEKLHGINTGNPYAIDRDVKGRYEALKTLKKMVDDGILPKPVNVTDVFQHCHSTYSHSPNNTPSYIAWRGYVLGLKVTGVVDHDTIAGFSEFREAARILGLRNPTCGYEQRLMPKNTPFETMSTNSPGNKGETYVAFHAVTRDRHEIQEKRVIPAKIARFRKTLAFINGIVDLKLDYDTHVALLTEAGNPTEKHVAEALAQRVYDIYEKDIKRGEWANAVECVNKLISECGKKAGIDPAETAKHLVKDANELKNRAAFIVLARNRIVTVAKQIPEYAPTGEEVISDREMYKDGHKNGELVYYLYLGDPKKCEAENRDVLTREEKEKRIAEWSKNYADFVKLDYVQRWLNYDRASMLHLWFLYQKSIGADGIGFMPNRNSAEEIEAVIEVAKWAGFKRIANGMDVNLPRMPYTYFNYSNRPDFVKESLDIVILEREELNLRALKEVNGITEKAKKEGMGRIRASVRCGNRIAFSEPEGDTEHVTVWDLSGDHSDIKDVNALLHLAAYKNDPNIRTIVQSRPVTIDGLIKEGKTLPALTPDFVALLHQKEPLILSDAKGEDMQTLLAKELRAKPKQPLTEADIRAGRIQLIGHSAILSKEYGVFTAGTNPLEAYYRAKIVEDTAKTYRTAERLGKVNKLSESDAVKLLMSKFEIRRAKMLNGEKLEPWEEEEKLETVEVDYDADTLRRMQDELAEAGREISKRGLVVGPGGNISALIDGHTRDGKAVKIMLIKASGKAFETMKPEEYIGVTIEKLADGSIKLRRVAGLAPENLEPSTEAYSHAAIYLARPDVRAIVHAHSPIAAGFTTAEKDINMRRGAVKRLGYVFPGSGAMPKAIQDAVSGNDIDSLIITNHGPFTFAPTLEGALEATYQMEHVAMGGLAIEEHKDSKPDLAAPEVIQGYNMWTLSDESGNAFKVTDFGANVISLVMGNKELLYHKEGGKKLVQDNGQPVSGGMPFMFPWTSRIEKGFLNLADGRRVDLKDFPYVRKVDGAGGPSDVKNVLHGMTDKMRWDIEDRSENSITLHKRLRDVAINIGEIKTLADVFGDIEVRLTHRLYEGAFESLVEVENLSKDRTARLSFGFHPSYKLGEDLEGWQAQIPAAKYWEADKAQVPLRQEPLDVGNTDYDFRTPRQLNRPFEIGLTALGGRTSRFTHKDGRELAVTQSPLFKHVMFWVPADKPELKGIASIQPTTSSANAINMAGLGIEEASPVVIEPGRTVIAESSVRYTPPKTAPPVAAAEKPAEPAKEKVRDYRPDEAAASAERLQSILSVFTIQHVSGNGPHITVTPTKHLNLNDNGFTIIAKRRENIEILIDPDILERDKLIDAFSEFLAKNSYSVKTDGALGRLKDQVWLDGKLEFAVRDVPWIQDTKISIKDLYADDVRLLVGLGKVRGSLSYKGFYYNSYANQELSEAQEIFKTAGYRMLPIPVQMVTAEDEKDMARILPAILEDRRINRIALTVPVKVVAVNTGLFTHWDPDTLQTGAVNTAAIEEGPDGRRYFVGRSTDGEGTVLRLKEALAAQNKRLAGSRIGIIGLGGFGRPFLGKLIMGENPPSEIIISETDHLIKGVIPYELAMQTIEDIKQAYRKAHGEELKTKITPVRSAWLDRQGGDKHPFASADAVIDATSVGMNNDATSLSNLDFIRKGMVMFHAAYRTDDGKARVPPILVEAYRRGADVYNGVSDYMGHQYLQATEDLKRASGLRPDMPGWKDPKWITISEKIRGAARSWAAEQGLKDAMELLPPRAAPAAAPAVLSPAEKSDILKRVADALGDDLLFNREELRNAPELFTVKASGGLIYVGKTGKEAAFKDEGGRLVLQTGQIQGERFNIPGPEMGAIKVVKGAMAEESVSQKFARLIKAEAGYPEAVRILREVVSAMRSPATAARLKAGHDMTKLDQILSANPSVKRTMVELIAAQAWPVELRQTLARYGLLKQTTPPPAGMARPAAPPVQAAAPTKIVRTSESRPKDPSNPEEDPSTLHINTGMISLLRLTGDSEPLTARGVSLRRIASLLRAEENYPKFLAELSAVYEEYTRAIDEYQKNPNPLKRITLENRRKMLSALLSILAYIDEGGKFLQWADLDKLIIDKDLKEGLQQLKKGDAPPEAAEEPQPAAGSGVTEAATGQPVADVKTDHTLADGHEQIIPGAVPGLIEQERYAQVANWLKLAHTDWKAGLPGAGQLWRELCVAVSLSDTDSRFTDSREFIDLEIGIQMDFADTERVDTNRSKLIESAVGARFAVVLYKKPDQSGLDPLLMSGTKCSVAVEPKVLRKALGARMPDLRTATLVSAGGQRQEFRCRSYSPRKGIVLIFVSESDYAWMEGLAGIAEAEDKVVAVELPADPSAESYEAQGDRDHQMPASGEGDESRASMRKAIDAGLGAPEADLAIRKARADLDKAYGEFKSRASHLLEDYKDYADYKEFCRSIKSVSAKVRMIYRETANVADAKSIENAIAEIKAWYDELLSLDIGEANLEAALNRGNSGQPAPEITLKSYESWSDSRDTRPRGLNVPVETNGVPRSDGEFIKVNRIPHKGGNKLHVGMQPADDRDHQMPASGEGDESRASMRKAIDAGLGAPEADLVRSAAQPAPAVTGSALGHGQEVTGREKSQLIEAYVSAIKEDRESVIARQDNIRIYRSTSGKYDYLLIDTITGTDWDGLMADLGSIIIWTPRSGGLAHGTWRKRHSREAKISELTRRIIAEVDRVSKLPAERRDREFGGYLTGIFNSTALLKAHDEVVAMRDDKLTPVILLMEGRLRELYVKFTPFEPPPAAQNRVDMQPPDYRDHQMPASGEGDESRASMREAIDAGLGKPEADLTKAGVRSEQSAYMRAVKGREKADVLRYLAEKLKEGAPAQLKPSDIRGNETGFTVKRIQIGNMAGLYYIVTPTGLSLYFDYTIGRITFAGQPESTTAPVAYDTTERGAMTDPEVSATEVSKDARARGEEGRRLIEVIDDYFAPVMQKSGPGRTEPTATEISWFNFIFREFDDKKQVIIYMPEALFSKITSDVEYERKQLNKKLQSRTGLADTVVFRAYNDRNVEKLLRGKDSNVRRIFLNDLSMTSAFSGLIKSKSELLVDNRVLTAQIKQGSNLNENSVFQAWLFKTALLSCLVTDSNMPTVGSALQAEVEGRIKGDSGKFVANMAKDDSNAADAAIRVKYFVYDAIVRVSTIIGEQIRILKAFWTAA
jgi:UDP-glucose 4-epimerase